MVYSRLMWAHRTYDFSDLQGCGNVVFAVPCHVDSTVYFCCIESVCLSQVQHPFKLGEIKEFD